MSDVTDLKILNLLLANSRTTTTEISSHLDISNVATKQRITKMEKAGVIKGYTAVVDYKLLGYNTISYIGIFLEKAKHYQSVIEQLNVVPHIVEAHFTTGNYSIFAKLITKNNTDLMEVLSNRVQSIDGIARTETFISLEEGIHKAMQV